MASVNVLDWKKSKVGTVDLPDEVFNVPWRADIVQAIVRWQLASRRQGTHMTKTRAFVRGGGKKPYKQKGTGNARRGSTRSPLIRGGAILFGPQPKSYAYVLPKKFKKNGLKVVLSRLLKDGKLVVVDTMASGKGKTKELNAQLKSFGIEKAVLIDKKANDMFSRAARNLKNFRYYGAEGLNVYDLLKYGTAVCTKDSVESIVNRCVGSAE